MKMNSVDNQYYIKKNMKQMSVLFVKSSPSIDIRTHSVAKILKSKGVQISLAYMSVEDEENRQIEDLYEHQYPIFTFQNLIEFVNGSQFDLIHSSNEPDYLTALLVNSNKPVIHDCCVLRSACRSMSPDEMAVEYIANVKSRGIIYTSEKIRDMACKMYEIDQCKTFVLGNFDSDELQSERKILELVSFYKKVVSEYEA